MLRGVYAPSDFKSRNYNPSVHAAEKLAIIEASPITGVFTQEDEHLSLELPFGPQAEFSLPIPPYKEHDPLIAWNITVADEQLYGNGIGSRLLQAGVRYACERVPNLERFHTGWIRLGLVNTVIKAFGEDNVAVVQNDRYGWQGKKPLEYLLDDYPPEADGSRVYFALDAQIDRERAMTWEVPEVGSPVPRQPHH